ncbi:hypothetical protein A1O1_01201 [Capronia coronata CBS 617.96]|uniref:Diphthamide biosynthesis protein 4 n=1 Tax=Capronia coronata CBS 617.96 TaxID=1182541 RepID=W9Z294_9EURO|nr:uncharacterized protein A1O1_01201 [Capronia coronata CBS 617.96]EXJ96075.1 hypothetical protein A1O1_01201 [Capronia coronata CBS 617.96]
MSNNNTPSAQGSQHTHYDVLQLPRHGDGQRLSKDEVKAAYRRALLLHHPDKVQSGALKHSTGPTTSLYSVDEIVVAYEVLADPEKRHAYDRALDQNDRSGLKGADGGKGTHIGVELYDLEDLVYDEVRNIWSKSCRCGDEQGYTLTETDLERESQHGEIYVGCRGCSLFIKVLFGLVET